MGIEFAFGVILGLGVSRLLYCHFGTPIYSISDLNAGCEAAHKAGYEEGYFEGRFLRGGKDHE